MPLPFILGGLTALASAPTAVALINRKGTNKNAASMLSPESLGNGDHETGNIPATMAPVATPVTTSTPTAVTTPQTPATATSAPSTAYDTPSPLAYNPNAALWDLNQMVDATWNKGGIFNPAIQGQLKDTLVGPSQATAESAKQEATTSTASSPSFSQVVNGVIAGHYGNGKNRIANIAATGQDPAAVQKAVNAKMQGSKKAAPIRQANPEIPGLNKNGNWMDTLNSLLPYLALVGGAYYMGRKL